MQEGRRGNGALNASIGLGLVSGWAVIAQAVCLAQIVNGLSIRHGTLAGQAPWFYALAALFLFRAALAYAAEIAAFRAASGIKTRLRGALLAHLFARGPLAAAGEASADIAATLLEGVEALEPYFSRYMPQMAL